MTPGKLFVRDPRKVSFLHDQVQKILALADKSSRSIPIREDDDFGFMAMQFLYKQIQHTESVLSLVPRRDAGLIARTMIEGLYQLLWASQASKERARLWRSFSIIHDWRLIKARLSNGIPVGGEVISENNAGLKRFGNLHRVKGPKGKSSDPYHKNWRGGVSLSDIAAVDGRELYEGPYAELSDWEHWGVGGIGDSISRENGCAIVTTNSDRIAGLSLLAAFQSLYQTLGVADARLKLNVTDNLQAFGKEFRETLDSFYAP